MRVATSGLNFATLWGLVLLLGGLLVVSLPGVSVVAVESAFGVLIFVVGVLDLVYAVSGRGKRLARNRRRAAVRGTLAVLLAPSVIIGPTEDFEGLLELLGLYLVLRGGWLAVGGLARRRRVAVARGVTYVAVAVLSLASPATAAEGIVLCLALGAAVVGVILVAYGVRGASHASEITVTEQSVPEILWAWVRAADVGASRRGEIADGLYFEPPTRVATLTAWWVMLLLSTSIATFAILVDSTAVVIGAMLIAPLMVPILGLAGALVNGWPRRAVGSAWLVLAGVVAAVASSYLLARWAPPLVDLEVNTQISARVEPTVLDLLIAVLAGAAGAFATVNVRVASSIAGVAIAVALVPPLSVVGITLAAGELGDAAGAALLFLTNFVAIVLSAALVFVLSGFADVATVREDTRSVLTTLAPFVAIALLILVPLVFTSQGILADATVRRVVTTEVETWLGPDSDLRVTDIDLEGDEVLIRITGSSVVPPVDELQAAVDAEADEDVTVVVELISSEILRAP